MSNAIRQFEVDDALSGLGSNQTRLLDNVASDGPVVPQSKLWVGVADSLVQRGVLHHDCTVTPWVYRLTVLGQICANDRNQIHSCMACGRWEDDCSHDPCDAVIADRGEQVDPPASPICKDCGTDHSDGRDRERCKQEWLASQEEDAEVHDHSMAKEDRRNDLTLGRDEFYEFPYPTPADTNMDTGSIRGYDLFDSGEGFGIQREDEIERFPSDHEAQWQAVNDAVNGDVEAQLMLWGVLMQVGREVNMGSPSWLRSAWESQGWVRDQVKDLVAPKPPLRKMGALDIYPMVSCKECGSGEVQISYPAWHDPNSKLEVVESDLEADPLSCYCTKCCTDVTLISWEFGEPQTIIGRW